VALINMQEAGQQRELLQHLRADRFPRENP
jgi:hypothetical protein